MKLALVGKGPGDRGLAEVLAAGSSSQPVAKAQQARKQGDEFGTEVLSIRSTANAACERGNVHLAITFLLNHAPIKPVGFRSRPWEYRHTSSVLVTCSW